MESVSNERSENIEHDNVDASNKPVEETVQENIQIIINEPNKTCMEKFEESINEISVVVGNEESIFEPMEVIEVTELSKISRTDNLNKNTDMKMEVDQIEILENINEIQTDNEDLIKNKENTSKTTELEKVQQETDKNIEQSINKEINKDEKVHKNESEVTKYDKKINKNKDDANKDKNFSKNIECSSEIEENVINKDLNKGDNTKNNTDNDVQTTDCNNAKQPKLIEQTLECIDIDMENESEKQVVNEKETGSGKKIVSEMEVVNEKKIVTARELVSEKKNEVEKTEFVQISQDKEDSHVESQPEAEDPFGGDNLNIRIDNIESMEVDSANNKGLKLNEQDNLKDDEGSKLKEDVSQLNKVEAEVNKDKDKEKSLESSTKKPNKTSTESSEEKNVASSAEVLPGQDDEICIIPDSTKVNKSIRKDKTTNIQNTSKEKKMIIEGEIHSIGKILEDNEKSNEMPSLDSIEKISEDTPLKVAAITSGSNDIQVNFDKSLESSYILTSDIIEVDDDNKNPEIEEISSKEVCKQCKEEKTCMIKVKVGTKSYNVCSEVCKIGFIADNNKATDIPSEGVNSKRDKRCANCLLIVEAKDERNLSWETMEFCNEECLGKFQTRYGSYCRNCNGAVQPVSLGKYCVRFGYDVRQFCCSTCLEEFKKGLKVCSYCQKDISAGTEGFLAPVGDKGQFKDFCTQDCMEKYSKMNSSEPPVPEKKVCGVCQEEKVIYCEVQIDRSPSVPICSEPCFAAFKFVNKVDPDQCSTCKKYFQLPTKKGFVVFYEDEAHTFCNKTCLNVFIITNRKIVPCNWCKVKKYNFDMIKKELKTGQVMMMCSLNCLTLYQVSINAVSARRINCDFCKEFSQAQYHLTMSDATIRNFCSYKCVMNFQAQYTKSPITIPSSDTSTDPVPTGIPKRAIGPSSSGTSASTIATTASASVASQLPRSIQPASQSDHAPKKTLPVISSVTSLAAIANGQTQTNVQQNISAPMQPITLQGTHPVIYKQQVVTRPTSPVEVGNKMTQCKPQMHTKGVSVRPIPCNQETQTDGVDRLVLPIPVPLYVPFPVHMYSMPFPVPVPIPIPIPVPIFIPTTRNSAKGIFKEIKRIQEKIPSDPFEAELLMMAEMVATEKKNESDSDSNDEARDDGDVNDGPHTDTYSPEGVDSSNAFGDDMLQMALKMATGELDETAVDLETALTPNTIQTPQRAQNEESTENDVQPERIHAPRGRKRGMSYKTRSIPSKRGRRSSGVNDVATLTPPDSHPPGQARFMEPMEKPDANMALKYTFGVNAWRQWVINKNAELEKQSTSTRKLKLFKTDLLQLTADELNYSLCLFVKEVRKPNGAEYAPDTIYYLCLGIQQYLFENSRIDNIFTDAYYEKFTDCLNEVAKKFTSLYNDALYVVTRVEEEHLWECKQLGAHSPHVLLNTLMYFTTKHFNLVSVEEHMQLSFSHIMKHWKRNPAVQPGTVGSKVPGSRNVLLRFYPPQSTLEANSKKKKVYEQQENEDNPLRCPVKLYEFYLSKCPESVKTRNDVFYLLPERSCVPDSPVWYSTSPLAKEHLIKMLYRIKMVKEINVALLSC